MLGAALLHRRGAAKTSRSAYVTREVVRFNPLRFPDCIVMGRDCDGHALFVGACFSCWAAASASVYEVERVNGLGVGQIRIVAGVQGDVLSRPVAS